MSGKGGKQMDDYLSIENLNEILEDFWDAREQWNYFGLKLKMKPADLESIGGCGRDSGDKFESVLKQLLKGNGCTPITRACLIAALEAKTVGLPHLAQELRQKYSLGTSVENRERSGGESELSEDTGDNQDATSSGYESHRNDDPENQQNKPEGLKHDAQVFKERKFENLTKMKLRRMQTCYSAVLKHTKESFKRRNVSVQEVTETTDRYNDQPEVTALKGVSTMDGIWAKFKRHTKWYNSDVVEAVIDVSGVEQDRKTFDKFKESRRGFLRHLDSNPDQCHKAQITLKLEESFEHFSDQRLEQVCLTLCNLLDGTKPCPINVEEGCVKATFEISIDVAKKHFPLTFSKRRKFHKALPTLVRVNYFIPSISNHSEDDSMDKRADCISDEGYDEVAYDASTSESDEEALHQTAPKAQTHKLCSRTRASAPLRGIVLGGLMILTLLAIQVLAVNLGIFARNFDGTLGGIRDRKLGYPGIIITIRRNDTEMFDSPDILSSNITTLPCDVSPGNMTLSHIKWGHIAWYRLTIYSMEERFLQDKVKAVWKCRWSRDSWLLFLHDIPEPMTFLGQYINGVDWITESIFLRICCKHFFDWGTTYNYAGYEKHPKVLECDPGTSRDQFRTAKPQLPNCSSQCSEISSLKTSGKFKHYIEVVRYFEHSAMEQPHQKSIYRIQLLVSLGWRIRQEANPGNRTERFKLQLALGKDIISVSGTCIGFVVVFVALMMVSKKLPGNTKEAITVEQNKDHSIRKQLWKQCRKRAEERLIANRRRSTLVPTPQANKFVDH